MKQTVFISVINRKSSSIFRVDFNPNLSESIQIVNFLESKKLENKIFQIHKYYEYKPNSKIFIPHFNLVEIDKSYEDICSEVENA